MFPDIKVKALTRQELYEAVWTTPIVKLAAQCGMSDVGLAKRCRRLGIPIPGRGYWQKLETGKPVGKRPALPKDIRRNSWAIVAQVSVYETGISSQTGQRITINVAHHLDLSDLHPLTALTFARMAKNMNGKQRILVGPFGVSVSPISLDRTILIIDALVRALDLQGYDVGTAANGDGLIVLGPDSLSFSLKEDLDTGHLALCWEGYGHYGHRTKWRDTEKRRLEPQLGHFVTAVGTKFKQLREQREKEEHRAAEQARIANRNAARKWDVEFEKSRQAHIRGVLANWDEARRLRKLAKELDKTACAEFGEWAAYARQLANQIDPLCPDLPTKLNTCDYMSFEEWRPMVESLLGHAVGAWTAEQVYKLRFTPEEAAEEVEWGGKW